MVSMWALQESRVCSVCLSREIFRRRASVAGTLGAVDKVPRVFCAVIEEISEGFPGWYYVADRRIWGECLMRTYLAG